MSRERDLLTGNASRDVLEELIWALLDDQLSSSEREALEQRLANDEGARQRYIECVQIHCQLTDHFSKSGGEAPKSLILGLLPSLNPADVSKTPQSS